MSAGLSGIGPLSVRYAYQIKELLNVQAVRRMAAEQQSARAAEAEHARAVEASRSAQTAAEPVKIDVKTQPAPDAKVDAPKPAEAPAAQEPVAAVGQLVDEIA